MAEATFWSLIAAAVGVAATHAVLGPDHYLPFVMLGRARGWSAGRAAGVTALFGGAHVLSSIALGSLGILAGVSVGRLELVEEARGTLAAWALVGFGLAYASWGLRRAVRRRTGLEPHDHGGHVHLHRGGDRPHGHPAHAARRERGASFWSLFAIFVLGPCEPLIPLFVLPASRGDWAWAAWTALAFGATTVACMVGMTLIGLAGLRPVLAARLARWSHALAGAVIAVSGLAILLLGV